MLTGGFTPEITTAIVSGIFAIFIFILGQLFSIYHDYKRSKIALIQTILSNDVISRNLRFFWRQTLGLRNFYSLVRDFNNFNLREYNENEKNNLRSALYYLKGRLGYRRKKHSKESKKFSESYLKKYENDVLKLLKSNSLDDVLDEMKNECVFKNIKQCFDDSLEYYCVRNTEAWFTMLFGLKPIIRKRLEYLLKRIYKERNNKKLWDEVEITITRFLNGKWRIPIKKRFEMIGRKSFQ